MVKVQTCEICGGKLPEIMSWVQCRIMNGYVCMSCHWNCTHHRVEGSVTWCTAAYDKDGTKK